MYNVSKCFSTLFLSGDEWIASGFSLLTLVETSWNPIYVRLLGTLYPQKLAVTSPTSGGCSVGIVCSRNQATELSFLGSGYKSGQSDVLGIEKPSFSL
jgi:hypothetical protein